MPRATIHSCLHLGVMTNTSITINDGINMERYATIIEPL